MTILMSQWVRRVPFGIRLAVVMLAYFGLSSFLVSLKAVSTEPGFDHGFNCCISDIE